MAEIKEIAGTAPSYTVVFYDTSGLVVDPTTYDKIDILVYNFKKGRDNGKIISYTTETPLPSGMAQIVPESSFVSFTIPSVATLSANSGDNIVEVWINDDEDCIIGILNEFISPENGV